MTPESRSQQPNLRLPKTSTPIDLSHLIETSVNFTSGRKLVIESLMERPWFQRTSKELQLELAKLPDKGSANHDGFLADLAGRPDNVNGLDVIELVKLPRGNFALIPTFKVRNEKGDEYTYEYVSWRYGPKSGAKGLAFIKNQGEITHFIVLRGGKFATGKSEFDTIGGFVSPEDMEGITNVIRKTAEREIKEELGVPDLKVEEIFDLGKILVDAGMTNNSPSLFAAIINAEEAKRISDTPLNPDQFELRAGALIVPMSQLPEVMKNNQDGFFLSAIARAAAHGIIDFKQLSSSSKI